MAVICPIQNDALFKNNSWFQTRPVITQHFGLNPQIYKQFGLKGHNGTDFRAKVGTPLFAATDGVVRTKDSKNLGYGLHIKTRNPYKLTECVYGHLSDLFVLDGQHVNMGDLIGLSGDTGFSTGPHLHFGYRMLKEGKGDIFAWGVQNYNNGFAGYFDVADSMLAWKGSTISNHV